MLGLEDLPLKRRGLNVIQTETLLIMVYICTWHDTKNPNGDKTQKWKLNNSIIGWESELFKVWMGSVIVKIHPSKLKMCLIRRANRWRCSHDEKIASPMRRSVMTSRKDFSEHYSPDARRFPCFPIVEDFSSARMNRTRNRSSSESP